ncbi:MAG: histidinol-phosphate transaminase [Pseudomonadota bacterium]
MSKADVLELVRDDLRQLKGYQAAAPDFERLRLHANESPWDDTLEVDQRQINRYPPVRALDLEARLAEVYGVSSEQLLVTRGSDDGIDLLVRTFCAAGQDAVLVTPPTFGMYAVAARLQNAQCVEVPLRADQGWRVDESAILNAVDAHPVRLLFLCSPNNPTGSTLERDAVLRLCQALGRKAAVVVDQAYGEFTGEAGFAADLDTQPNLIVLRTLSKAHGLAGVRCGALLADPALISLLATLAPPYATPSPVIGAVLQRLSDEALAQTDRRLQVIAEQRARLRKVLDMLPYVHKVWPSEANFLLAQVDDAARLVADCYEQGVLLRSFRDKPGLGEAVRISVGTPAQTDRLIAILESIA